MTIISVLSFLDKCEEKKNDLAGLSIQASKKKQALVPEIVSYAFGFVCFEASGCNLYSSSQNITYRNSVIYSFAHFAPDLYDF